MNVSILTSCSRYPVSCIASFSNQGGVRPQYIQVTDTEGCKLVYQIIKVHRVQDHKNSDITFLCDIMEHDRVRMIELFFQRKIDQWFIKVR